jgi:uncharacterized protein (DUF1330 family)
MTVRFHDLGASPMTMTQPVYVMGQIDVKDHQAYFEEYGMPVLDQFADAGAEVLVASADAEVLEATGQGTGRWW